MAEDSFIYERQENSNRNPLTLPDVLGSPEDPPEGSIKVRELFPFAWTGN
jgi:hypothetical protein